MGTTADKLNKVLESKNSIKVAIQNKGQPITDETPLSQYSTLIENLDNTSDATATSAEIVNGKTAYVNGEKITGTITEYEGAFIEEIAQVVNGEVEVSQLNTFEDENQRITKSPVTHEEVI